MAALRNKYAGEEDPLVVGERDIGICPVHSLDPGHYFRIGKEVACDCPLRYTDDSYSEQILEENGEAMSIEELNDLARQAQGKAAYEYWLEHMAGIPRWLNEGQIHSWEEIHPDVRQHWIDLCQAETDAFLEVYREFGDQVPLEDHIADACEDYRKELEES